ncbi:hypothetical protein Ait01nite_076070 [Actinoplanes italicus]|nr:hypothetical protein Ait01nite_076070 [Actinoplanes italicus]
MHLLQYAGGDAPMIELDEGQRRRARLGPGPRLRQVHDPADSPDAIPTHPSQADLITQQNPTQADDHDHATPDGPRAGVAESPQGRGNPGPTYG